jgi:UDP-N-acetylglucosamine acyltransferase
MERQKKARKETEGVTIHPTALVSPTARLEPGVEVGPYTSIGDNVSIAQDTTIASHVVIEGWTTIGERCKVFQFASIGAIPQDIKFGGERSEVIIGDDNIIREVGTINRATAHSSKKTVIGNHNLLMAYSHIAHDCRIGNYVAMANAATLAGHIDVEDCAIIGGLVGVHQFARIGAYSIIGGLSGVSKDIPPYTMAVGQRAKLYGLNLIGLKRHGFSGEAIDRLKKSYRIIFRSGLTLSQAFERIEAEIGSYPEVDTLIEFIKSSERGITR